MSIAVSETAAEARLQIRDPARGEVLDSVPAAQPQEIPGLVQAAAKVQPLWALLRVSDRARYMRRMAQALIDDFDELVRVISQEQGRPAAEIAALELLPAIDALLWIAAEGARVLGAKRVRTSR